VEGDHSILSNLARIQFHGKDPMAAAETRERFQKLSRWETHGKMPENRVVAAVLRSAHDVMAARTMPRFVFMTPPWVSSAREILSARAASEENAKAISGLVYTFAEEFTDTPSYAFPDGSHGGFWVHLEYGQITVGAGPLPKELEPADRLTKGLYTPVVPIGRTVTAAMSDDETEEQTEYSKAAFRPDEKSAEPIATQSSPSGKGTRPPEIDRVFAPLHDELSKRTSGELPADYVSVTRSDWAKPQRFDRNGEYDPSWVFYNTYDIYGEPLKSG
jgi:hypothetical protein